jgi:hypothetical protein
MALLAPTEYEKNPFYLKPGEATSDYNTRAQSLYSTPAPPGTSSPAVISARQADKAAAQATADYQSIAKQQAALQAQQQASQKAGAKGGAAQAPDQTLTMGKLNPDGSVQQQTIINPGTDRASVQKYISDGWEPVEGALPEGVGSARTYNDVRNDKEYEDLVKELDGLRKSGSTAHQAYVSAIQGLYSNRKAQMEDVNRRELESNRSFGISSGAYQRSASFQGVLSEAERQGIARLKELDVEEKQLIAEAEQAYLAKDFQVLSKKIDLYNQNQEKKGKQLAELQKAALEYNKEVQKKAEEAKQKQIQGTRDASLASLVAQGIKSPTELLGLLNYDDSGNLVGDFTLEEISDGLERIQGKGTTPSGQYGEFVQLKQDGVIPQDMGWFNYLARKGSAGRKPDTPADSGIGGPVSGIVARDADSIMAGNGLQLSDLSTKNNYRATVAAELAKRRESAKTTGDIVGIIRSSAGQKETGETFNQSFEKAVNVLYQLSDLQREIEGQKTGPIIGILRSKNPYDVKSQQIKAQLQAIVPNLARGIYGEVGVLTDNDIKNYAKTLPKLTNPEDVRNAILGITLKSVQRSLENKIRINANRDLTHLEDIYLEVKSKADELLKPLEAQSLKDELNNLDLGGGSSSPSSSSNASFWGSAK